MICCSCVERHNARVTPLPLVRRARVASLLGASGGQLQRPRGGSQAEDQGPKQGGPAESLALRNRTPQDSDLEPHWHHGHHLTPRTRVWRSGPDRAGPKLVSGSSVATRAGVASIRHGPSMWGQVQPNAGRPHQGPMLPCLLNRTSPELPLQDATNRSRLARQELATAEDKQSGEGGDDMLRTWSRRCSPPTWPLDAYLAPTSIENYSTQRSKTCAKFGRIQPTRTEWSVAPDRKLKQTHHEPGARVHRRSGPCALPPRRQRGAKRKSPRAPASR